MEPIEKKRKLSDNKSITVYNVEPEYKDLEGTYHSRDDIIKKIESLRESTRKTIYDYLRASPLFSDAIDSDVCAKFCEEVNKWNNIYVDSNMITYSTPFT